MNDLVDIPGTTLIDAYRINNAGQILAEARLHACGYAYYRLDPIPEPASLGLAALAVRALSRRTRAIAVDERRARATRCFAGAITGRWRLWLGQRLISRPRRGGV